MANDLTKSIKYVDTAATIYATSCPLGKIVWTNMGDNKVLQIDDADGLEMLFYAKSALANDQVEFDFNGMVRSLKVTTIGGGVVIIHPYLP